LKEILRDVVGGSPPNEGVLLPTGGFAKVRFRTLPSYHGTLVLKNVQILTKFGQIFAKSGAKSEILRNILGKKAFLQKLGKS